MNPMSLVAAIGVNVLVPLLGMIAFVLLCRWMQRARVPSPPYFSYFILFATFGGWLVVGLTALFWKWSGMATLETFYLVFVAPFVTAVIAFRLLSRRTLSHFHSGAYFGSIAYSGLAVTAVAVLFAVHFLAKISN